MKRQPQKALGKNIWKDGGVEGRALTPSCKSTSITTNCWATINGKMLEPTKKDTLHPKTKERLQRDGRQGSSAIESNPIPARWASHKLLNNYTTEVLPLEWGSEPRIRLPSLEVQQWEEDSPESPALKASGIDCRTSTRLEEAETPLLEGTHSLVCTRTQGKKAVTP